MRAQLIGLAMTAILVPQAHAACFDGKVVAQSTLVRIPGSSVIMSKGGMAVCFKTGATFTLVDKASDTACPAGSYAGTLQHGVHGAMGANYSRIRCIGSAVPVYASPNDALPAQILVHAEFKPFGRDEEMEGPKASPP